MTQLISAEALASSVPDGSVVFVTPLLCEEIGSALAAQFAANGRPRDLTLVWTAGMGTDGGERKGLDHFATPGMLARAIYGGLGRHMALARAIARNHFEAFSMPQGVLAGLLREMAAGRSGLLTNVGLHTFADPLEDGGCMNKLARQATGFVERVTFQGEQHLRYSLPKPDIGIIRGTTLDSQGNLSCDGEALLPDSLDIALAVRQAGGKVYAQALQLSDSPLPPHQVAVPAALIDGVVMASSRIMHPHTGRSVYDGRFLLPFPGAGPALPDPMPEFGPGMVVARRALREVRGCDRWMTAPGLPEEFPLALMADPEDIQPPVSSFGVVGGYPLQGDDMGASLFASAFLSLADTAAHCAAGLDAAVLPLGYVSAGGDVNTGYPGNRPAGCGAVVELAHAARKVVFCGSFMADEVEMTVGQGALTITADGRAPRFTDSVTHRTLAATEALRNGQTILCVTERCVIRVTPDGLMLEEVAPGIDIQRDILDLVPVPIRGADTARMMDPNCFT